LLELAPAIIESSSRKECLPSTRQDVLSDIINWATDSSATQSVLWLHGVAGSGKSTIANTVASFFRDLGRLGAFIFFDRAFSEKSHPSKVIRTLAYKLGIFDPRIGTAIATAIDNYPGFQEASLGVQFTKLIIEPLASLPDLQKGGPIVVVFEALDECGNSAERKTLMEVLGTELSRLPSVIRVLLVSRPLGDINTALRDQQNILPFDLDSKIDRDIVSYFEYHLGAIQRKKFPQQPHWPGDDVIQDLATRSCGLFIWAFTALMFIDRFDPAKCLAVILRGDTPPGAQAALDDLYKTALTDVYAWDDDDFVEHFRSLLGVILVLQNPLATSTLDRLIGLPESGESIRVVSPLACVVALEPVLHLLHPSFADFLFSRERCGRDIWHFNAALCHRYLALKCLDRLSDGSLKRNICNLTLSGDLESNNIPDDVVYGCTFWITHLCSANDDALSIVEHLEAFLKRHLLHWFEVMSILRKSRDTVPLLGELHRWTMVSVFFSSWIII